MLKIVGKMWKSMWGSLWEKCGKVYTFLTFVIKHCEMLRKTFGFTRSFGRICTIFSTEHLFGFTEVIQFFTVFTNGVFFRGFL